jgi:Glucodextranase, domain B
MPRRLTTVAMLAALAAVVAGCETDSLSDPSENAAKATDKVRLSIMSPRDDTSTRARSILIRGRVTRGALVRVNGRPVSISGRRFELQQKLDLGRNRIRVVARKDGYATRRRTVTVTRTRKPRPAPVATPAPTPEPTPEQSCHPSYEGACLDPNSPDYDCEGGSGDGPDYTGTVTVVGDDPYELNADPAEDNLGCEE